MGTAFAPPAPGPAARRTTVPSEARAPTATQPDATSPTNPLPTLYRCLTTAEPCACVHDQEDLPSLSRAPGAATSLPVSSPDDPDEREAERVADGILSGRVAAADGLGHHGVYRSAVGGASGGSSPGDAPPAGGRPLSPGARAWAEPRFGVGFGAVRVHTGGAADRAATGLQAEAFTVDDQITFAAGRYAPETASGRRLLAHELTHVVQHAERPQASRVQRQQAEPTGLGSLSDPAVSGVPEGFLWAMVVTPTITSTPTSDLARRILRDEVGPNIDQCTARFSGSLTTTGWWSFLDPARGELGRLIVRHGDAADKALGVYAVYRVRAGKEGPGSGRAEGGATQGKPVDKTAAVAGDPTLAAAVQRGKEAERTPATPLNPSTDVLKDPALASFFLQILEHFSGRPITPQDEAAAKDGLTSDEIASLVGIDPLRKALSGLLTQGYAEFKQAGGRDLEQFKLLIQTIDEQFIRGNPTATHNWLRIGHGIPEADVLGIADRKTDLLLYDAFGVPFPAIGGGGLMRDHGYIGTRNESGIGIDISSIQDPGLRQLLTALRQTFGDPTRMAWEAASIYFENIERVNAEVRKGLSDEVISKFEDMLVPFVGFIAGHAVSSLLIRYPNPQVAVVGLVLKGLLTAAGYVMDIEFGAEALSRLMQAAAELIRVEKNTKGTLTKLSEAHITSAAVPIRQMVADIALAAGVAVVGGLVKLAARGLKSLRIECTFCTLEEKAAREAAAKDPGKANLPPEKPPVEVPPLVRGFAVEDMHLDRIGYRSLRDVSVTGIDGIRGGDFEPVIEGGKLIKRYTSPDAVSVKSTEITDPVKLRRKVVGEFEPLRGRYVFKKGGYEIRGLGQRRYDLVFEEGVFSKFTKETLATLAALKGESGRIVFRWYVIVGGREFFGPEFIKQSGKF